MLIETMHNLYERIYAGKIHNHISTTWTFRTFISFRHIWIPYILKYGHVCQLSIRAVFSHPTRQPHFLRFRCTIWTNVSVVYIVVSKTAERIWIRIDNTFRTVNPKTWTKNTNECTLFPYYQTAHDVPRWIINNPCNRKIFLVWVSAKNATR